ncbi:MAG: proteasome component M29 [Cirrosporium novae-zelandiae]|nr:MAG: proteasome component M29 [Cirrosporium novae-zelandiae]
MSSIGDEALEARELELIGKVELRIALADSDKRLESLLGTYLAPLLLKLASEHVAVRNKVISVCQHINTRVKPASIKLPVSKLLEQCKNTTKPLVRHFDLHYIQLGLERLPAEERTSLLPTLLGGISQAAEASAIFNLILRVLPLLSFPERGSPEDEILREKLGLLEDTSDAAFLVFWFGKAILLPRSLRESTISPSSITFPGVSPAEYDFLDPPDKPNIWKSAPEWGLTITDVKAAIARFLSSGAFLDDERFLPLLFASADVNSRLSDIADGALKRFTPDLEKEKLIQELYKVYLGTEENGCLPASSRLKMKVLATLSKSIRATKHTAEIQKVIEQGFGGWGIAEPDSEGSVRKRGLEASKLHGQLMNFINWAARMGPAAELSRIAPDLIEKLRDYIELQGWPTSTQRLSVSDLDLRGQAYVMIGLLAKSCDQVLLEPNLQLLRWLFNSLAFDGSGSEIAVSIDQALGSILNRFSRATSNEIRNNLKAILSHQMTIEPGQEIGSIGHTAIRSTQYASVRFANRSLPYSDVVGRKIDLIATGASQTQRHELVEEGFKGLNPYWFRMLNPPSEKMPIDDEQYEFPRFGELLTETISHFAGRCVDDSALLTINNSTATSFSHAIEYCRNVLFWQALADTSAALTVDVDWEKKLDGVVDTDEDSRQIIRNKLLHMDPSILLRFLGASLSGLIWSHGKGLGRCPQIFVEICSFCSNDIVNQLSSRAVGLKEAIYSNDISVRENATRAFGLLASSETCTVDQQLAYIEEYRMKIDKWEEAVGANINQVHGAILAVSFLLSRLSYRQQLHRISDSSVQPIITLLHNVLVKSEDDTLATASCMAISQLSLSGVLAKENLAFATEVIDRLGGMAQKAHEKAILALGHFATNFYHESTDVSTKIIDKLCDLYTIKSSEIHFAVGEALSVAAAGWESKSLIAAFDVEGSIQKSMPPSTVLQELLKKILKDCRTTKPGLKKASGIWLLCLVQFCGHLDSVQSKLRECQAAFMGLLSARDDLVQETGSRGLTLVYQRMEDKSMKEDLIRDLVGAFTGSGSNLSGTVSKETQLFEPGALPTGDGSVTTYKDIMSLASEVGDPSLVYRFMSLASNNAIWSSRAAFGRFGLSNILADSSIDGYMSRNTKLYPKLFRYRFDPNPNVQRSMNDIWSALVKDPSATIDEYFDSIMEDLLKTILGKEWRVRQASCAAIADLVSGRPLEKYEQYIDRVWTASFKVLDDIKETVRLAAMGLVKTLTATVVRSLEAGETSSKRSETMLQHVIPFLLSPASLEANAPEVQGFAITTLLKIIKKGSPRSLRPFIPDIVGKLLGLLSGLESPAVNYIRLNADKYGLTGNEIDEKRMNSVRGSPMMEAIERCLDMLDELSMKSLSHSLEHVMRAGVDLPSKVGCSRVLVSLSTRKGFLLQPYADSFLRLLEKLMLDRNATVSASNAAAAGYLTRLATKEQVIKLIEFAKQQYFNSEDEAHRIVAGELIYSISKFSPDRFKAMEEISLPFVFVAKRDGHEPVKELFQKTWNDNVGGSRTVSLYMQEILQLASEHLDSTRWVIKHACALAIADVVQSTANHMNDAMAEEIWPYLEKTVQGKSWEGKEIVLQSFVKFVAAAKGYWRSKPLVAERMKTLIFIEIRRRNADYRVNALTCLGDFAEARIDLNLGQEVIDVVKPIIKELCDDDITAMDIDSPRNDPSNKASSETSMTNALNTLYRSINPLACSQAELEAQLSQIQEITSGALTHTKWNAKLGLYEGMVALFNKLIDQSSQCQISLTSPQQFSEELLSRLWGILIIGPSDLPEDVRLTRTKALLGLARLSHKCGFRLLKTWGRDVKDAQTQERSQLVRQELNTVLAVLEKE